MGADLHYSHKETSSLKVMQENNIVPVFIPASCTDVMQVLDVCCNRPYKVAVRAAFRDHIHLQFKKFTEQGCDASHFRVPLKGSELKPFIPNFISQGLEKLHSPSMKETIKNCFNNEGRVGVARSAEQVSKAQQKIHGQGLMLRVVVPEGEELDEYYTDDDEEDLLSEEVDN